MNTTLSLYDPKDSLYGPSSPQPVAFKPDLVPEARTLPAAFPGSPARYPGTIIHAPNTEVLIRGLAPNYPELYLVPLPEAIPTIDTAMSNFGQGTDPTGPPKLTSSASAELSNLSISSVLDARDLAAKATAAVRAQEDASISREDSHQLDAESRHDSAQDKVPQLSHEQKQRLSGRTSPSLRLQTSRAIPSRDYVAADTITTSPTLRKHIITTAEGNFGTLPAYYAGSPTRDGITSSPHGEKLPGLHQVIAGQLRPLDVRPLDELAEVATQHDPRIGGRHHSRSFGSTTAPSPLLPYHYGNTSQPSAPPYYARSSALSPTSTISDQLYMSPTTQYPGAAYYADRRSNTSGDIHPPMLRPSLPSASSSAESYATTGSSVDDYSTAQTTPSEGPESTPRPILPPPPGMPQSALVMGPGFMCDYPGCTAAPFQTQYLLR